MSLKKLWFRGTDETSVDAYQSWAVRWRSRFGQYHSDTCPEVEVFPSKEEAEKFAAALRDAFKLVRHTSGIDVEIIAQQ